MTVEEAKKIAKLECALEFCKKESMLEQYVSDEKWKYFDVAANAIEKQMPKKVTAIHTMLSKAICPKCERLIDAYANKYCRHCGQALDWSDTE